MEKLENKTTVKPTRDAKANSKTQTTNKSPLDRYHPNKPQKSKKSDVNGKAVTQTLIRNPTEKITSEPTMVNTQSPLKPPTYKYLLTQWGVNDGRLCKWAIRGMKFLGIVHILGSGYVPWLPYAQMIVTRDKKY
jgi:hypothetical protein